MKKTHYTKIIIEGFQSIVPQLIFNLDNTGLNLIKGPNGVGKSTTFNAILWAEYGVNLKKSIEPWDENKTPDYRGTRVVVERTDGEFVYRVCRHLNFKGKTTGLAGGNKLMIFKRPITEPKFTDAHLVGEGLHKSDMQELINAQLGMDSRTFLSSIFFGQKLSSLITSDNSTKRDLFEKLFDVDFVEFAKGNAKQEQDRLTTKIHQFKTLVETTEPNLEASKETLASNKKILKEFSKTKKERIQESEKRLNKLTDKKATLQAYKKEYELDLSKISTEKIDWLNGEISTKSEFKKLADKSLEVAGKDVSSCKKSITDAKNRIEKYEKEILEVKDTCPTCTQSIPKTKISKVKKELTANIKKEEEVIKTLEKSQKSYDTIHGICVKNCEDVDAVIEKLETELKEYKDLSDNKLVLETKLKSVKEDLEEIEPDIKTAETSLKKEKDAKKPSIDLKATETLILQYEKTIEEKSKLVLEYEAKLDKVKWWVSKGFGSSGIKAFVFNAMLGRLNTYAHYYSAKLGFRVEFSIDMTKASKPFQTLIYKGSEVKFYEDLSGGQKQRVDICIAFAMHDLISSNSDINILIMDEVFEGLDNEGIEVVFELIRDKAETKSVYLITHSDLIDSLNSRSFTFALDSNDNTYLKN